MSDIMSSVSATTLAMCAMMVATAMVSMICTADGTKVVGLFFASMVLIAEMYMMYSLSCLMVTTLGTVMLGVLDRIVYVVTYKERSATECAMNKQAVVLRGYLGLISTKNGANQTDETLKDTASADKTDDAGKGIDDKTDDAEKGIDDTNGKTDDNDKLKDNITGDGLTEITADSA